MNGVIFFNVDTQKDFINPDGALYIKDAELIKPQLKFLTEYAAKHKIKVVNTADYHDEKDVEISDKPDFKTTFPKHCMIASEGSDFIEETNPKLIDHSYFITDWLQIFSEDNILNARNIIIYKNKFDVFEGNRYSEKILNLLKPDIIVVYGVSGDYCVDYAVKGLIKRKYDVVVIKDAIKSINETPFNEWRQMGIKIIFTVNMDNFLKNIVK